jgi:8-oxo-dGTP pyrophosphatase MutT (NUDIX family)
MNEEPIRAAGGIVKGTGRNKGKIAIIRRRRYEGEIALPKGKLNPGEDERSAALREVEEETGIKAVLGDRAGETRYAVRGRLKTVTYFLMEALDDAPTQPQDSAEVGNVEWLTPADAIAVLSHAEDKKLIERVFAS